MNATQLASGLCKDMVRAVASRGMREFVVTNFHYPDGDLVNVYVETKGDSVWLSDFGTTVSKCGAWGVELTDTRRKFIQSVCNAYGMDLEHTVLRKRLTSERVGMDCLAFCEGISRVSALEYQREVRQRPYLAEQVEGLLKRKVEPIRTVARKWTDAAIDPHASFPVDYRLNGQWQPRNIFHVVTAEKSTLISAVSNFFKAKNAFVPTLSIVDPELQLGEHHLDRLQLASTHIRFGVTGNEDAILGFALEGVGKG